ncbi:hypothetical protein [Nocardiopsis oceani]
MPLQSKPAMPGTVTAARTLLFVVSGLSGVVLIMNAVALVAVVTHPEGTDVLLAEGGQTMAGVLLNFALGLAVIVLLLLGGLRVAKGGRRNHLVVRLLVGAGGLLSLLHAVVVGQNAAFMGFVLPLIVLMLLQSKSSREWFDAVESAR